MPVESLGEETAEVAKQGREEDRTEYGSGIVRGGRGAECLMGNLAELDEAKCAEELGEHRRYQHNGEGVTQLVTDIKRQVIYHGEGNDAEGNVQVIAKH